MKFFRIIALVLPLLLITGCSQSDNEQPSSSQAVSQNSSQAESMTQSATQATVKETEPLIYIPDETGRPFVNFYHSFDASRQDRDMCGIFESTWVAKKDIVILEPLAFVEPKHFGSVSNYAQFWKELWDSHAKANVCKTGFVMNIQLLDGTSIKKVITKPSDTESFYNYVEMYIYDDINQKPNTWYSHLLDSQMNDKTLMSSIKITAGSDIAKVSKIVVSVFVYENEKDFDSNGNFIGGHISSTTLINK